jgi:Flp pilus assembly protein TadB
MNLINNALFVVILSLALIATALGMYTKYLHEALEDAEHDKGVQKALLQQEKHRATTALYMCKKDLQLFKDTLEIEQETKQELTGKIEKEKDYEILASDKKSTSECYRDSNGGWVFK